MLDGTLVWRERGRVGAAARQAGAVATSPARWAQVLPSFLESLLPLKSVVTLPFPVFYSPDLAAPALVAQFCPLPIAHLLPSPGG